MSARTVSRRKRDLQDKVNSLRSECAATISFINTMLKEGIDLASTLDGVDGTTFLKKYPEVNMKLDLNLNKVLQLNCSLELVTDDEIQEDEDEEEEEEEIGHVPHDASCCFDEHVLKVSYAIQTGDILDMVYISGNSPYEFWLGHYSTRTFDQVIQTLTSRFSNKQLRSCNSPHVGMHVCVYDGHNCYRAKVTNIYMEHSVEVSVINIDNGKPGKVNRGNIYHLDQDIADIPIQGLCCRLQGSLGDPSLWNDVVASLFSEILAKSNLVVTITARLPGEPPQFVVDVDCHNEERNISKIELSTWITATVFPKLQEVKEKLLDSEALNSLFGLLNPVVSVQEVPQDDVSQCKTFEINLPLHLSSSDDKRKRISHAEAMAVELANKKKLGSFRLLPDWNLPQSEMCNLQYNLPVPSTSSSQKLLISNQQMKTSSTRALTLSPTEDVVSTLPISLEWNDPAKSNSTLSALPDENGQTGTSAPFVIGNGICLKPELEKCDFTLLQPILVSTVGETYDVMLAHIENPGEFYVHIVCEENVKIDKLHVGMNEYYNAINVTFKSKAEAKKYVGTFCAVYCSTDKQWCRGLIVDWNESDDNPDVRVKFVDFGNASLVPLAAIQPLRQKFTTLPICAQSCHLANIHPVESTIGETWSLESTNLFKCLVDMNTVYSVVLTESSNTKSISLPVLLEDNHDGNCSVINKSMVELGYAVHFAPIEISYYVNSRKKIVKKPSDVQTGTQMEKEDANGIQENSLQHTKETDVLEHWDPMSEDFFSETNTMYHDDEDATYVVTGYKAQDEKRVCKVFAKKGRCYKGESCLKEHIFLHPDGWTTDKETVFFEAFSQLILPEEGSDIVLDVTQIVKSNSFWAIIRDDVGSEEKREVHEAKKDDTPKDQDGEEEETLVTLNNYMNQDYNVKALQRLNIVPALGQIILARYVDGRYYRARVLEHDEEKVLVVFVDYGNKEWIKMSDIRDIEPKYLHLPFQAVQCVIGNVEAFPDDVNGAKFFQSLVGRIGTVNARVVSSSNNDMLMEVLISDDQGYDLGNMIVKNGFGMQRNYILPQRNIEVLAG